VNKAFAADRPMRAAPTALALLALMAPVAQAQGDGHPHHHHHPAPGAVADPLGHGHGLGPAGATYDLRWLDAMVQHHTGALRMSEVVFDSGDPGVGALARAIWSDQAQEIRAMGQWRRAWYPQAPVYPVAYRAGGDPESLQGLERMSSAQINAMRMGDGTPTRQNRVVWFLEGMLMHHGGALQMAHDARAKSTNPTVRRLARQIIAAQRREIISLRGMLRREGLNKPAYHRFDQLFAF
jgi:uncharacterized protein (DUF305 family)